MNAIYLKKITNKYYKHFNINRGNFLNEFEDQI